MSKIGIFAAVAITLSFALIVPAFAQAPFSAVKERVQEFGKQLAPQSVQDSIREAIPDVIGEARFGEARFDEAQFSEVQQIRDEVREQVRETKEEFQERAIKVRREVQTRLSIEPQKPIRINVQERAQQLKTENIKEAAIQLIKERKETYQNRIQDFRKEVEQKRVEYKSRVEENKAELQQKLQQIQSEQKRRVVERIDVQISELNERMLNHFLDVLERIEAILTRISTRADKAEAFGLDVSAARTALNQAYDAIETARNIVTAQFDQVYAFEILSEDSLKMDVGVARQGLHEDLRQVRDFVKTAHDLARSAALALAQVPRVDDADLNEPEITENIEETTENATDSDGSAE